MLDEPLQSPCQIMQPCKNPAIKSEKPAWNEKKVGSLSLAREVVDHLARHSLRAVPKKRKAGVQCTPAPYCELRYGLAER